MGVVINLPRILYNDEEAARKMAEASTQADDLWRYEVRKQGPLFGIMCIDEDGVELGML